MHGSMVAFALQPTWDFVSEALLSTCSLSVLGVLEMQACASGLQAHSLVLALLSDNSLSNMQLHCTALLPPEANSRLDSYGKSGSTTRGSQQVLPYVALSSAAAPRHNVFVTLSPISH